MKLRLLTAFVRPALLRASAGQGGDATYNTLTVTGQGLFADGSAAAPSIAWTNDPDTGFYRGAANAVDVSLAGVSRLRLSTTGLIIGTNAPALVFSNSGVSTTGTYLQADALYALAQRAGTNAQTFRIYNTFTDASNYERGYASWVSNVFEIGVEVLGTGVARSLRINTTGGEDLLLARDGTTVWRINMGSGVRNLQPQNDDAFDFGAAGSRIKNAYIGTAIVGGGLHSRARYITGSYSVVDGDFTILGSTATNAITVLLPTAPAGSQMLNVKKMSADANRLTISGNGNLIDGLPTASTIAQTRPNFQLQFSSAAAGGSMWHIL